MSKKVWACVVLCLFLASASFLPLQALAKQPMLLYDEYGEICIDPLWATVTSIAPSLNITDGQASLSGSIIGTAAVTRIEVDAVLVRVNANGTTTQVGTWRNLYANNRKNNRSHYYEPNNSVKLILQRF